MGANLADPLAQMIAARRALAALEGCRMRAASSLYRTRAVSAEPQPDYLNAVLSIDCALSAEALLHQLLALEQLHGRMRTGARDAARTLDLDLLCFGQIQSQGGALELPHPRMHLRAFVLAPLCELAPSLALLGYPASHWLELCDRSGVVRLSPADAEGWPDGRS